MIGLATGHRVNNYGTKLQAYAMQEIMRQRGLDYEIIQFNEIKGNVFSVKNCVKRLYHLFFDRTAYARKKIQKQQADLVIGGSCNIDIKKNICRRFEAISSFDKNFKIRKLYINRVLLNKYSRKYSAVFCGSDQAWLPANIEYDFYTLNFVANGVKRIAYAPSFGVDSIPYDLQEKYKFFLSKMDAISVREKTGVEIVRKLINKDVPLVLDPTLLVGRKVWDGLIDESDIKNKEKYIFVYLLGVSQCHRVFCEKVSQKLGLPLVSLPHFITYNEADEFMSGEKLYDVDPCKFIGLIKNAAYVITDSFHCSIFALQYHVPFSTLQRFKNASKDSTNSRIYSLLEQFGVVSRLVGDINDTQEFDRIDMSIDFDSFEKQLKLLQVKSNNYLDLVMKGLS